MDEVLNVKATKDMAVQVLAKSTENNPQDGVEALVSAFNGGPKDEVTRVLDEMPAQERQVLRGRYVGKKSVGQLSALTGMTTEGVKSLSDKALLKFAKGYNNGRNMIYDQVQE